MASRAFKILALVVVTLAFILSVSMSYIVNAALEFSRWLGLFDANSNISWNNRNSFKNVTFAPAPWAFSVWGLIYFYQLVIIVFWWTLIFRRAYSNGPYLCQEPDLLPYGLLIGYFMSSVSSGAWSVFSDRGSLSAAYLVPMSILLFGIAIGLYIALFFSYLGLWRQREKVEPQERWLVVGIVQNGLSIYAGWATIASFINLDSALFFYGKLDEKGTSVGCLAGVMVVVIAYAVADLTVLDRVTRFVFTPHLVVIWACGGSLARNLDPVSELTYMVIALAAATAIALVVKIVLCVVRQRAGNDYGHDQYQVSKD